MVDDFQINILDTSWQYMAIKEDRKMSSCAVERLSMKVLG